jgi:hypothetical protein
MNTILPIIQPVDSSLSPRTSTRGSVPIKLPAKSASRILRNLDHTLSLNDRRMAVVNLEAALASHNSMKNHNVHQLSKSYRNQLSASLRISPSKMDGMPHDLMYHWINSER